MPWRNEEEIKGDCHTYKEKFDMVESDIMQNILKHDPYFGRNDIDADDLIYCYSCSDS